MQFISYTSPKILLADEGKKIRAVNDVYEKEHFDEEGNLVEEHFPHLSDMVFIADNINTLEECQNLYVEEIINV